MIEPTKQYSLTIQRLILAAIAVSMAFILSTMVAYAAGTFETVDPLPEGCVRPTPPGETATICCLSGFVFLDGEATEDAEVKIFDTQGEIGRAFTKHYPGIETRPYYYFDLPRLKLHELSQTRAITPGDVITLVAIYNGYSSAPVTYTVQPGGQNFHFNFYDPGVIALRAQNTGQSEQCKFSQITAADVDSRGNLYLWDYLEYRMQIMNSEGDCPDFPEWQREPGGAPDQVGVINGIAIHPINELIYLADNSNRRLAVYHADGEFPTTTPEDPFPKKDFPELNQVRTDANGDLYIEDRTGIQKFDITGTLILSTAPELSDSIKLLPFDVSQSGEVFLVNGTTNGVLKLDANLQPVSFTISISNPTSIAIDDDDTLFIFDQATFRLHAFDSSGTRIERSWDPPTFTASTTVRMAIAQNDLYLISQLDAKVLKYPKAGGSPVLERGGAITNSGSIVSPRAIAIAPDQSLFIADTSNGLVSRMVNNVITKSWGAKEFGVTDQWLPYALTFDAQQRLWVSTLSNNQDFSGIQRFRYDAQSQTLVTDTLLWNGSGTLSEAIKYASAIATDKNGFVYLTDSSNNRVLVLKEELATKNLSLVAATETLSQPFGIVVDDRNSDSTTIYVSERGTPQIAKFRFDGAKLSFVETISSPGSGPQPFKSLYHLAIANDGTLFIPDAQNGGIYRLATDDTWNFYGNVMSSTFEGNIGIAVDAKEMLYLSVLGTSNICTFKPLTESAPVATIVHLSGADLFPGDILTAVAAGQDGDESNTTAQYEWTTASGLAIITETAQITIPIIGGATQPDQLGPGLHWLNLRVQDNEGLWSEPVSRTLYVARQVAEIPATPIATPNPNQTPPPPPATCLTGSLWTMLLYLDADNNKDGTHLLERFKQSLAALQQLNHPCLQVAVQIDGPTNSDTQRGLIRPNPAGTLPLVEDLFPIAEQKMNSSEGLTAFLQWGQTMLPSDHYYLAIADHGNAYQGIAFDHTTDPSGNLALTLDNLHTVLTSPGVLPIDILHLDACSMALFDVAYELRGEVDFLIASQYIGWSYFAYADYASYLTQQSDARQLAGLIANRYANLAEADQLPYTISALDLERIAVVKNGMDDLAVPLKAWLNTDANTLPRHSLLFDTLRYPSQFFDSNSDYLNTPRDAYVDLRDFVERLKQASLTTKISEKADKILVELERADGVVLTNRHSQPTPLPQRYWRPGQSLYQQPIDLSRANGLSLYYPAEGKAWLSLPPDTEGGIAKASSAALIASTELTYTKVYSSYIQNQLFDFTLASRWDEFLVAAYGQPPADVPLATPEPPLAPIDPATLTPTPTATPTNTPTAPPTLTPIATTTPTHTPTATATPTAIPTLTATPTPTAIPLPQLTVEQTYQQNGNRLQFDTTITNQGSLTATNLSLVQSFTQPLTLQLAAGETTCQPLTATSVRCDVVDIAPAATIRVTFQVQIPSTDPVVTQGQLWVNETPVGTSFTPVPAQKVYLPVVMK